MAFVTRGKKVIEVGGANDEGFSRGEVEEESTDFVVAEALLINGVTRRNLTVSPLVD